MTLTSSVQEAGLKQFEPTWVVYDPADPYGLFLAFCTLSPVYANPPCRTPTVRVRATDMDSLALRRYITVMHTTLVFFQRDIDSAFLLAGQVRTMGVLLRAAWDGF